MACFAPGPRPRPRAQPWPWPGPGTWPGPGPGLVPSLVAIAVPGPHTASPGPPQVWSQQDNAAFRILNEALAAHGSPEAKLPGVEGDEAPRPSRHSKPAQTLTPTRALALTLALALALALTPAPTPTLSLTWPRP